MRCDGVRNGLIVLSCTTREIAVMTSGLRWSSSYLKPADRTVVSHAIDHLERSIAPDVPQEGPSSLESSLIHAIHCTGDTVILEIEQKSLRTIVTVLNPLVNGVLVWEWEFHTLTGYDRSEMREVFNVLHLCAVTSRQDLPALK